MDCFCGCGAKLRRDQLDLNLQASRIALELMAWDKARVAGRLGLPAADDAERVLERGAGCYRRLLVTLHGESSDYSLDEGEEWLRQSEAERGDRQYMTTKGGFLRPDRLLLTEEDHQRLDRAQPESSFSGRQGGADEDQVLVSRLERLGTLRAEGVLTDDEFAAAKARVLGSD